MAEKEEQTEEKSSGGKGKLLLIGGLLLAVVISAVVGAIVGGVFLAGDKEQEEADGEAPEEVETVTETLVLDPFTVQLADKGRKPRYLRFSLTLGVSKDPDSEAPEGDPSDSAFQPRMRDRVLRTVGRKKTSDLETVESREELRSELLKEISSVLPESRGRLLEIYITEFMVQ